MLVNVKNRSNNTVIYSIPDGNVRRTFAPNEIKRIDVDELQKLVYQPGGPELIAGYLLIEDKKVLAQLMGVPQPEYWLDEKGVIRMLTEAPLDEFLDCLDFAPPGVLEMIQQKAVQLPLNDNSKREAIKKVLGFDVTAVIQHEREVKEEEEKEGLEEAPEKKRRVSAAPIAEKPVAPAGKTRRTAAPAEPTQSKYKVVARGE